MLKVGEARMMAVVVVFAGLALILGDTGCTEIEQPPYDWWPKPLVRQGHKDIAWSPTGEYLAYYYGVDPSGTLDTCGIYLYDLSESTATRLIPANLYYPAPCNPDFSPDGRWLAFSWYQQIWKCLVTGDSLVQLTSSEWNFAPAWSPSGSRIAYHSRREDQHGVHIMKADGSEDKWIEGLGYYPHWLDEERIVSSSRVEDRLGIFVTNISSGATSCLLERLEGWIECRYLRVDPSGERLLFSVSVENKAANEIWVLDIATLDLTQLEAWGDWPAWSPDGSEIAYTNLRNGRIWIMNADGSDKRPLFEE